MPFLVIDTEGEYASLRSLCNVIVVGGERGDLALDVDFSRLFRASIEDKLPVVLDLSDTIEKKEIANRALSELYEIESRLRQPYLVMVEEADQFAPQIISRKTTNVLEEISIRGRKRGIGLFITTQRPANVSKNVLAQCSYGFIGKLTIENDIGAIRILFDDKSKLTEITRLRVGEFITFGLASDRVFKVKTRSARHLGATPSVESYKASSGKIGNVIRALRSTVLETGQVKTISDRILLRVIHMQVSLSAAKEYAEKSARKKFLLFGKPAEKIDPVEVQYLPLRLCNIRIPTRHKDEFLEYSCLVTNKCELVKVEDSVGFAGFDDEKGSRKGYKAYLSKSPPFLDNLEGTKSSLLSEIPSDRAVRSCIGKFFPSALLTDSKKVCLPIYRITLRKGNKVRTFMIDAIYGKKLGWTSQ